MGEYEILMLNIPKTEEAAEKTGKTKLQKQG